MKSALAVFGVIVAVVVIVGGITLGGWQASWWFTQHNVQRQYDVNVHSQQYQQGQIEQLRNDVQGYDMATDPAQQAQIKATFCAIWPNLTQPPVDLQMAAGRLGC